jgi:hypothetical protein
LIVVLADVGRQGSGPLSGPEAAKATGTRDRVKVVMPFELVLFARLDFLRLVWHEGPVTDERNSATALDVG